MISAGLCGGFRGHLWPSGPPRFFVQLLSFDFESRPIPVGRHFLLGIAKLLPLIGSVNREIPYVVSLCNDRADAQVQPGFSTTSRTRVESWVQNTGKHRSGSHDAHAGPEVRPIRERLGSVVGDEGGCCMVKPFFWLSGAGSCGAIGT